MDMQGYSREAAAAFMLPKLNRAEFKPIAADADNLVAQAIDADFAYMHSAGILTDEGLMGGAYYDDDDAFEYILDALAGPKKPAEPEMRALSAFVDQYMELQEQYMASADLIDWE